MQKINKIWLFLFVSMFLFSSCDQLKEALTTKTTINAPDVNFAVMNSGALKSNVKSEFQDVVELYRGQLDLEIGSKVKESLGVDLDVLKGVALSGAAIEVTSPADFNMNELAQLKLYYNDTNTLVAEVDSTDNILKTLNLKVVNADLFAKLDGGETLTVIITNGQNLTPQIVNLKFSSSYEITVGL